MAQAILSPQDCCSPCESPITTTVPGPQGEDGADCTPCADGENAFGVLTSGFTMPAELADVTVTIDDTSWLSARQGTVTGQIIHIQFAGNFEVRSITSATQSVVRNLEDTTNGLYTGNAPPTTAIPTASRVSPSGLQGPSGLAGSSGAPDTFTYITKLDHTGSGLSNSQPLAPLATGFAIVTTVTGAITTQAFPITLAQGGTGSAANPAAGVVISTGVGAALSSVTGTDGHFPYWSSNSLASTSPITLASGVVKLTPTGNAVELRPSSSLRAELRFYSPADSTYTGLQGPDSGGTGVVWKLPAAEGILGYGLLTDGAGQLTWGPVGTGSATGLTDLNGATASTQLFVNEANIGISTVALTGPHTFVWSGTLAVARGGTGKATFTTGVVVSPAPGGTTALSTITGTDNAFPYWSSSSLASTSPINYLSGNFVQLSPLGGAVDLLPWASGTTLLRFYDANASAYQSLQAYPTLAGNIVWILPPADATLPNQALISDGAGNLTWSAAPLGTLGTPTYIPYYDASGFLTAIGPLIRSSSTLLTTDGTIRNIDLLPYGASNTTGIRFYEGSGGTDYCAIKGATAVTTAFTLILPDFVGVTDQFLKVTVAGVVGTLSFASIFSGTQFGVPYYATTTTLGTTAAPGSNFQVLHGNTTGSPTWGLVALTTDTSGTLPVGDGTRGGGTGVATFTAGVVISPGGTTALSSVVGTANHMPYWSGSSLSTTGPLVRTSATQLSTDGTIRAFELLPYGVNTTSGIRFYEGSSGSDYCLLRGADPVTTTFTLIMPDNVGTTRKFMMVTASGTTGTLSFETVNLTTDVTGLLPNGNGGTGKSSAWTANGVAYADSTTTLTNGSNLTFVSNILSLLGTGFDLLNLTPIRLYESGSLNFVSFRAPGTLALDTPYILPNAYPIADTGYALGSDTVGAMSWVAVGAGVSGGTAGYLALFTSATALTGLAFGTIGKVLASNGDGTYTWTSPTGGSFSGTAGRFPFTGVDTLLNATDSPILYTLAGEILAFSPGNNQINIQPGDPATTTVLAFYDAATTEYIGLRAPSAIGSNIIITLPSDAPADGDVLHCGSDNLAFWAPP